MAFEDITIGLEQDANRDLLQQLSDNIDWYQYKWLYVTGHVGESDSVTDDDYSGYSAKNTKFYLPEGVETMRIYAEIGASAGTGYARFQIDGSASYELELSYAGTRQNDYGTIDVSGLSAGWHTLSFQIKSSYSTYTAYIYSFSAWLQIDDTSVFSSVSWASGANIDPDDLNQMMTNLDVYKILYMPIIGHSFDKNGTNLDDNFEAVGSGYVYVSKYCNKIQVYADIGNDDSSEVGIFTIGFDGISTFDVEFSQVGDHAIVYYEMDVTNLAEGWHYISFGLRTTSSSSGDEAVLYSIAMYMDLNEGGEYSSVTFADAKAFSRAKLYRLIRNLETYRHKKLPIVTMFGKTPYITSTSYQHLGETYFYLPDNCDTIRVFATIGTFYTSETCYLHVSIDDPAGYDVTLDHSDNLADPEEGTIDVSALSAGWHTILVEAKSDTGSEVILAGLSIYAELE